MVFATPVVLWPEGVIDTAEKNLIITDFNTYKPFVKEYRKAMSVYGIISGSYMLLLSTALVLMFWRIFTLINNGHRLSQELQHQKGGLKLMMGIIILSYFFAGIINLFYGQYTTLFGLTIY